MDFFVYLCICVCMYVHNTRHYNPLTNLCSCLSHHHRNSDIYGRDYSSLGLSGDTIASSFGKLVKPRAYEQVSREDLAKAALVMITNNICSLTHLYARQVLRVPSVVFVGNFLRNNLLAMRMLSYALTYWSQNTIQAIFLKHEGYFGALGSFIPSEEPLATSTQPAPPLYQGFNLPHPKEDTVERKDRPTRPSPPPSASDSAANGAVSSTNAPSTTAAPPAPPAPAPATCTATSPPQATSASASSTSSSSSTSLASLPAASSGSLSTSPS